MFRKVRPTQTKRSHLGPDYLSVLSSSISSTTWFLQQLLLLGQGASISCAVAGMDLTREATASSQARQRRRFPREHWSRMKEEAEELGGLCIETHTPRMSASSTSTEAQTCKASTKIRVVMLMAISFAIGMSSIMMQDEYNHHVVFYIHQQFHGDHDSKCADFRDCETSPRLHSREEMGTCHQTGGKLEGQGMLGKDGWWVKACPLSKPQKKTRQSSLAWHTRDTYWSSKLVQSPLKVV